MPKLQIFLAEETPSIHDLTEEKISIGRLPDNSLQISDESVSSHHAELVLEHGAYHLHDLGSTNGTFINGEPVTDAILKDGDQLRIGKVDTLYSEDVAKGGSQPPPEAKEISAETSAASSRPLTFFNTSPFSKQDRKRDPLAIAATVVALLGGLGAALALYGIFIVIQPPIFN